MQGREPPRAILGAVASHRRSDARSGLVAVAVASLVGLTVVALVGFTRSGPETTDPATEAANTAANPAANTADNTADNTAAGPPPPSAPAPAPAGIADRAACPPAVVACVDLRTQQSWLQRDGAVVYGPVPFLPGAGTGRVAPGPTSSATPTGLFHVQRKNADEVSREFGEPMPHAVYFAPGGIAFHQGSLKGSSHGCVHLRAPDATAYFDRLEVGDPVLVFS